MAVIPAVITNDARQFWPKFFGGLAGIPASATVAGVQWDPRIKFFRIGEGGWINPGGGPERRMPDPDLRHVGGPDLGLQALDADVDAFRGLPRYEGNPILPAYSRFVFQKTLTALDFTFLAPTKIEVACLLDFAEANEDFPLSGRNPEFWELGLFSDHPTLVGKSLMVAYGTFPGETKDITKQILNKVRIVF